MTKRESQSTQGWCAIGIERGKTPANLGTLWRSAVSLGASYVFTVGCRFRPEASDVPRSWRKLPVFSYPDIEDFLRHRAYDVPLVGVELTEGSQALEGFTHPERAIYLLGPEDGSLSKIAQEACQYVVSFQSEYCLNVSTAGSIVLYDRQTKRGRVAQRQSAGLSSQRSGCRNSSRPLEVAS
jgi:tRNA G18 (ribose-2'-O)-methylase SpoU